MSPAAAEVLQAAMNLPQGERAEVANCLWESVEGFANPEIAAAWETETAKRLSEMDDGSVALIPAEEVHHKLRQKYGFF